jgi:hypothetical protein
VIEAPHAATCKPTFPLIEKIELAKIGDLTFAVPLAAPVTASVIGAHDASKESPVAVAVP